MSFVKSLINQVGRDAGKVVSNQIFKDRHSTPYRRVGTNTSSSSRATNNYVPEYQKAYSELQNSLNFQTSHRPATLINKLAGSYTTLKNKSKSFLQDGYLDVDESDSLFAMVKDFMDKAADIDDILDLDIEANSKEISQLEALVEKTNTVFRETLENSIEGCKFEAKQWEDKGHSMSFMGFPKWVLLHSIFMGNYARTGQKNIGATIVANIFSLLLFPFIHVIFGIGGMLNYMTYKNRFKEQKERCFKLAELELERASIYQKQINNT